MISVDSFAHLPASRTIAAFPVYVAGSRGWASAAADAKSNRTASDTDALQLARLLILPRWQTCIK